MPVRGGTRAVLNGRGRRSRGPFRGWPNLVPTHGYDHSFPAPVEMDFTEDVQMPSNSQQQPWDGGNMESGERKRNGVFDNDHYSGSPPKKSRGDCPVSLLPTPRPPIPSMIRGPPIGNPYPVRQGFRPPHPHQEMMAPPPPPPMAPAGRYFGGGPHPPRGSMRPMNMGPPPRGPPPPRFLPPFNRPGPPPMPPPMGYRPNNPHGRGLPLPRGGPFPGRGFGGPPRMYRP